VTGLPLENLADLGSPASKLPCVGPKIERTEISVRFHPWGAHTHTHRNLSPKDLPLRESILYDSWCPLLPYVRSNSRHLLDSTNYRRGYATRLEVPCLGHLYCVYLQADRDKCTQVTLRLPQGFRTNDSSGNELFGILHSNLYGNPEAAFTWMQTLVRWMMDTFNADCWSATMCCTDSAICVIHDPHGITAFVVTYVDDCLAYSPSDDVLKFIQDKYNARFGVTVRNPLLMVENERQTLDKLSYKFPTT
jgi:hypothetical protein